MNEKTGVINKYVLFWYTSISFFILICSRVFLEYLVEPAMVNPPFDMSLFWVQQILYYAVIFIAITGCIGFFGKQPITQAWKKSVSLSWIILLPPIINGLFLKTGIVSSICSGYIGETGSNLILSIMTLGFFKTTTCGVSPGISIGIIILAVFVFREIRKNSTYTKAFLGTLIATVIGFLQGAFPGIIATFSSLVHKGLPVQMWFINKVFPESFLSSIHYFAFDTISPLVTISSLQSTLSQWSLYFTRWHYLSLVVVFIITIRFVMPDFFKLIKNSFQVSRIFLYGTLILLGTRMANNVSLGLMISNHANFLSFIVLMLSFFFIALSVTVVNDDIDQSIDSISNSHRPLHQGISIASYRTFGVITALIGFIGVSLISPAVFIVMILGFGAVLIYSVPPFRLRKTIIGTWFSAVLGALCAMLSGYYLVSLDQTVGAIPLVSMGIIGIVFGIVLLYKDFKDITGDSENNIKTLPVVLGVRNAKIVLGILSTIGLLGISLYYYAPLFIVFTLIIILLASIEYFKTSFLEKKIFTYFVIWLFIAMLFWK